MNTPNLPQEKLITNDGYLHPTWRKFFVQWLTESQQNLSNEGFVIPAQGGANFDTLNNSNNTQRFIFNSDNNSMMMNNSGNFESIVGANSVNGVSSQTTVGGAGAASPPPASPETYWNLNVNGTDYVLPLYKKS